MTLPTWPVAPTTAMLSPMSLPSRPAVHDGLVFRGVQVERRVHRADRVVERVGAGDHGDADLRRRDHLDVDAGVRQRGEEPRGDAGMRLHARADERELA